MKATATLVVLVIIPFILYGCGDETAGKAYSKVVDINTVDDVISILNNNCIVAETGDEGKLTSCNELCSNVIVPGSEASTKCALGVVYRNDGSTDKVTLYTCSAQFSPSRNDDGSMDSYLDCYCCSP